MAQSVEHIVHIDGVVGSSPTVTTQNRITFMVVLFLRYVHLHLEPSTPRYEHIDGGKRSTTAGGGNLVDLFLKL